MLVVILVVTKGRGGRGQQCPTAVAFAVIYLDEIKQICKPTAS